MPTENRSSNTEQMVPCDDGLHLIQLDENLSHYGWVFRKIEGGEPYSVRKATEHEMAHAKARQHLRAGASQIAAQYQPAAHIPASDGFSAGQMTVQGADGYRNGIKAAAELAADYPELAQRIRDLPLPQ